MLRLIAEEPDLTLQDVQMLLLREKALSVGLGSVWRFYDRHGIRLHLQVMSALPPKADIRQRLLRQSLQA